MPKCKVDGQPRAVVPEENRVGGPTHLKDESFTGRNPIDSASGIVVSLILWVVLLLLLLLMLLMRLLPYGIDQ